MAPEDSPKHSAKRLAKHSKAPMRAGLRAPMVWARNLLFRLRSGLSPLVMGLIWPMFQWLVIRKFLFKLLAGVPVALVVLSFQFQTLEGLLYNLRTAISTRMGFQKPSPQIVLIEIGPEDVGDLAADRSLSPDLWVKVAEVLQSKNPAVLGLVDFSFDYLKTPQSREKFRTHLQSLGRVVFGVKYDDNLRRPFDLPPDFQSDLPGGSDLPDGSRGSDRARFTGAFEGAVRDIESFARDGVSRRAFFELGGHDAFSKAMIQATRGLIVDRHELRGVFELADNPGIFQFHVAYSHPGSFESYSVRQLLQGKVPSLKDRVVILGYRDPLSWYSSIKTPFRGNSGPRQISLAELKAHELSTLLQNNALILGSQNMERVVIFGLAIGIAALSLILSPLSGLLLTVIVFVVVGVAAQLAFTAGYWFHLGPAWIVIVSCYYLMLPFRLFSEYKKRWELQRQHALLVEVEELKTNFMSLVSHDLKTPVARIQSMAELGLDDPQLEHVPRQKQILRGIMKSSEELLQFISNILSLSRAEAGSVELSVSPIDVNDLVEKTVEKLSDLAASKAISIDTELEPLFPMKCDVALIEQVIYNLSQNAILYSPSGTRVTLQTREVEGEDKNLRVEISVRDQGVGMAPEELDRIFQKFYRGRNPNKVSTKGSGLGLYLVKYFVELHGGRVRVSSVEGVGSEFVVSLPLEPISRRVPRVTQTVRQSLHKMKTINESLLKTKAPKNSESETRGAQEDA